MPNRSKVVIVGAGFGGLAAAKALGGAAADVTLVDRANHHLFQPLLYQVATAALSPSDIATATRTLVAGCSNISTRLDEIVGVDKKQREVLTATGAKLSYDYLILATGCHYSFFGQDDWAEYAPVLKTLSDALGIRERLLSALEKAEISTDPHEISSLLTFVVVGGGPTGVEMAGAIAELARTAISRDFRTIAHNQIRILLIEASPGILSAFPGSLPHYAIAALGRLGVEVMTGATVRLIDADGLLVNDSRIDAAIVIWAAGTVANDAGGWIDAAKARNGAIVVKDDCSIKGHPEIFAIGDVANHIDRGNRLPGLAPVAKQQGNYVGNLIMERIEGSTVSIPFRYRDWGAMAVIGRSHAVGDFGWIKVKGFLAWLAWSLVHLMLLVDFRSRLTVYINWAWSWFTYGRGARLITSRKNDRAGLKR